MKLSSETRKARKKEKQIFVSRQTTDNNYWRNLNQQTDWAQQRLGICYKHAQSFRIMIFTKSSKQFLMKVCDINLDH